jgi:hypothetical protein
VPVPALDGQVRADLPRAVVDLGDRWYPPVRARRGHDERASEAGRTPGEQGEAHALLVKAVSDADWQAARQALDELMRKLLVVHRLLEAQERLAKREPPTEPT